MIRLKTLLTEATAVNPSFVAYIKDQEGSKKNEKGQHVAYLDKVPAKPLWTIGYGHTGADVKSGLVWSETKATTQLENDIRSAEKAVKTYIDSNFGPTQLNQTQLEMLVDFAFNGGIGILKKFPSFTKAVVNLDWPTIKKEFVRYSGGKRLGKRNDDFEARFITPNLNSKKTTFKDVKTALKNSGVDYTDPELQTRLEKGPPKWYDFK